MGQKCRGTVCIQSIFGAGTAQKKRTAATTTEEYKCVLIYEFIGSS